MAAFTLRDVIRATGGSVVGPAGELDLVGVSTDTRTLVPGNLFVALRGPHFDGHRFLPQAAVGGAPVALVDRPLPPDQARPMVQVRVEDCLAALADLARDHARRMPARRVGVTGSNGKTSTKELLRAALSTQGPTVASARSFNNHIGVPLTLLEVDQGARFAVVEMGTNAPGEIARLADLARPEVGIITNCAHAHVERLGDLAGVIREKGALLDVLPLDGVAILNADDEGFEELRARTPCPYVSFGVRSPADFRASDIRFDLTQVTYRVHGEPVFVPMGGCHNVYNSLAALAATSVLGVPLAGAIRGLATATPPPGRLRPRSLGAVEILDDTYNANPGSVEAAMRTLAAARMDRRKVVVLGDMKELGAQSEALHREIGRLVSLFDQGLGLLVAVGEFSEAVVEGARETGFPAARLRCFASREDAREALASLLRPGDLVLVKGSRAMAMETLFDGLEVGAASAA